MIVTGVIIKQMRVIGVICVERCLIIISMHFLLICHRYRWGLWCLIHSFTVFFYTFSRLILLFFQLLILTFALCLEFLLATNTLSIKTVLHQVSPFSFNNVSTRILQDAHFSSLNSIEPGKPISLLFDWNNLQISVMDNIPQLFILCLSIG